MTLASVGKLGFDEVISVRVLQQLVALRLVRRRSTEWRDLYSAVPRGDNEGSSTQLEKKKHLICRKWPTPDLGE